ncbi:serine hydrolase [soil metagenome]
MPNPSSFHDLPVPATVSVWLGEPGGAPTYTQAAERVHYAASTMKLPLLVAAHRRHDRGEIDLDTEVAVHNEHRSAYDGSPFALDQDDDQDDETWALVGSTATLRDLARHAIVKSGNLATDLLLEHVGTAEVAAVLREAGCSQATALPRGIGDFAARNAGLDNLVTAADLALVIGTVTPDVERVLAAQEHRDQIPAGLPEGTYVANKTGWVDGVAHDVALVRPEHHPAYVLVVCHTAEQDEQSLYAANLAVSAAVWERWTA